MNKHTQSRLMIIASMAIFGTIGLFVRNIPLASSEIALYRAVLATILITAFLLFSRHKIPFRKIRKAIPLLFLSGIAMGFNWILLFEAYRYTTVSLATLSYYFAPVIVTLLCPILFHEKLTRRNILCFIMSTIGLIMITGIGDVSGHGTNLKGIVLGLGAAVLYASVVLTNKFIKDVDGICRTLFQFLAAILTLIPYVLLTGKINVMSLDSRGWIFLLVVGLIHTGIAYCMYFGALGHLPGQEAAILSYIDPLTAVLLSVLLLHETMSPVQMLGGGLILGFTLLNELD